MPIRSTPWPYATLHVGPCRPQEKQSERPMPARHRVDRYMAGRRRVSQRDEVARVRLRDIATTPADRGVVSGHAVLGVHRISAGIAIEVVVACAAGLDVVAGAALDRVVA